MASGELKIFSAALGLNTKDHPASLKREYGDYLSQAVNVDITDAGEIKNRSGYTVIQGEYENCHSLTGFLDRYAIYADGTNLYSYDVESDSVSIIKSDMTDGLNICFTEVGNVTAFTNGIERGLIAMDGGTVTVVPYTPFIADPTQENRQIVEFPMTDILSFHFGSMYGAIIGSEFIYCSEPYKISHYDQVKGYLTMGSPIKWIKSLESGLVVGTDSGIVALAGKTLSDLSMRTLISSHAILSSDLMEFIKPTDSGDIVVSGIVVVCHDGLFFISSKLEVESLSNKIDFDWQKIQAGAIGQVNNNYIFSGVT